jgi:hypothetical protein
MDMYRDVHWRVDFPEGEGCYDHAHPLREVRMQEPQRTFSLYIYSLVNTFHHNTRIVLSFDVPPFLLEIPFRNSMFFSELGEPWGEDG